MMIKQNKHTPVKWHEQKNIMWLTRSNSTYF